MSVNINVCHYRYPDYQCFRCHGFYYHSAGIDNGNMVLPMSKDPKAMMRVEGVKSVDIDYAARTAEVVYDTAAATPEAIAAASTDVGYPASVTDG